MTIKFLAGASTGAPFETGETRSVDVTLESLSASSGYENDVITYTATVLDSVLAKLPAIFVASLKINGTDLITDQVFDAAVYDQATGELSLDFTVPAAIGSFSVTLDWAEQEI